MTSHPKIRILIGSLLVILSVMLASWLKFLYVPVITEKEGLRYLIKPGTSIRFVRDDLYQKKIIQNSVYFGMLIRILDKTQELKAGEYLFPKGSTPLSMLQQMTTGSGMINHEFTIVPGWTFKELRAALLQNPYLQHTLNFLSERDVMRFLHSKETSPEGQFYPDTYYFSAGSADMALLKRAFKTMQKKFNVVWKSKALHLPYQSSYDMLIAASLIEKEAYLARERPVIAGVLINRLNQNMLLQCDPTVIYGLDGRFDGKIHKDDLLEDTPYNTYIHKGLPPSPIAMPSLESLTAAAHPMLHDYLYFVAKGDGSHFFSKTLAEHNAFIATMKKNTEFFNDDLGTVYLKSQMQ